MTNPKHTSSYLVAAMKDQIESWEFEDPRETWWKWQHQYAAAADRIEALEAEIERLRGALHEIDIEAANTIPPDGKDAAFAALFRIAQIINPFRLPRAALEARHD